MTANINKPGLAQWHEIQPATLSVPVGGITNVYYELRLANAPENFVLRLFDAQNATLITERNGNGFIQLTSGKSLLLAVSAGANGSQIGSYQISFSIPVIIREIKSNSSDYSLIWQGPTNALFTIEGASRLNMANPFEPIKENIRGTNLLHREVVPFKSDLAHYYRIKSVTIDCNPHKIIEIYWSSVIMASSLQSV
jgi:hypothetical protein